MKNGKETEMMVDHHPPQLSKVQRRVPHEPPCGLPLSIQTTTKAKSTKPPNLHLHPSLTSSSFAMILKKALITFKSKLSTSCHKFASLFPLPLKKPVLLRSLLTRPCRLKLRRPPSNKLLTRLLSFLRFLRRKEKKQKMSHLNQTISFSDAVCDARLFRSPLTPPNKLFPSPLTPAFARTNKATHRESSRNDNVDNACRSFENYLIHMVVEEGKVEDLMDIEELLLCWRNLKMPIFIDLVSRFYGELCKELFSSDDNNKDAVVNHKGE